MITGLPNFAVCIGYTNASWTLRADLTHRLVCKVLNHLRRSTTRWPPCRGRDEELQQRPLLDLSSGYIQRVDADFPRQGDRGAWRVRQNYLIDSLTTLRRDLDASMEFTPRPPCDGAAHNPDGLPRALKRTCPPRAPASLAAALVTSRRPASCRPCSPSPRGRGRPRPRPQTPTYSATITRTDARHPARRGQGLRLARLRLRVRRRRHVDLHAGRHRAHRPGPALALPRRRPAATTTRSR